MSEVLKRSIAAALIATTVGAVTLPSPVTAEAGCDDGENTGATKFMTHSTHWENNNQAWRYYARLTPDGTTDSKQSVLVAAKADYHFIDDRRWNSGGGWWDTGHIPELAEKVTLYNNTDLNRYYFYKRSCMK